MTDSERAKRFQQLLVPHFDSAYNFTRWLTSNATDAEDVMQEASLKAYRFLHTLENENAKSWFLKIVRNTAFSWLDKNRRLVALDDANEAIDTEPSQLEKLISSSDVKILKEAIAGLPAEYREVLVFREIEELSYQEIAAIAEIPEGTVMSRLNRARGLLKEKLQKKGKE